jgi:hypothetical protein
MELQSGRTIATLFPLARNKDELSKRISRG